MKNTKNIVFSKEIQTMQNITKTKSAIKIKKNST